MLDLFNYMCRGVGSTRQNQNRHHFTLSLIMINLGRKGLFELTYNLVTTRLENFIHGIDEPRPDAA